MRIFSRAFAALAFAVCSIIVTCSQSDAHATLQDESALALSRTTTVPFTLAGNHIYLVARINGAPYAFIFDTGGGATLAADVAGKLHLAPIASADLSGAGDSSSTVPIVRVQRLTIGDVTYTNGNFLTLPPGFPGTSPIPGVPYGGILGRELFSRLVTTIDYERSTISFTPPAAFVPDPSAAVIPVVDRHGIPHIEASINGHSGLFAVDAGSSQALTLTESFSQRSGLARELGRGIDVEVGRGIGGFITGTASRGSVLAMGSIALKNPLTMVVHAKGGFYADPALAGNIGGEILRRFTLTLDAPGNKLYLRPNASFSEPMAFNRAGLFTRREDGRLDIVRVIPGSPAEQAGIRVGDVITAIDGKSADQISSDAVRGMWIQPAGSKIRLDLARAGAPIVASVELRDIL